MNGAAYQRSGATPSSPRERVLNAAPIAGLVGVWLLLAFSYGGFQHRQWLLPGLGVALFGLVAGLSAGYPRRPRELSLAVLGAFALYVVWVGASFFWADSRDAAFEEAGRSALYLVVLALALTYLTDRNARRVFRYLVLLGGLAIVGLVSYRLLTVDAAGIGLLFTGGNRFSYPVSYPNNAAALFLVLFWPLVSLASDRAEFAPVRGLALGAASGLICLAALPQSRGALYALIITTILMFVLSPTRLRTLVFLLTPVALLVWAFPDLNQYWVRGAEEMGGMTAARIVLIAVAVATGVGLVLAILERWVHVSGRMKAVFGTIAVLVTVASLFVGYQAFERRVGEPREWLSATWERFTADQITTLSGTSDSMRAAEASSRLAVLSTSGRWDLWRVAWRAFEAEPVTGVGAGNYMYYHDEWRRNKNAKVRQPHSIELRVLSETGAVGAALLFGAFALGAGGILWARYSAAWQGARHTWLRRRDRRSPDDSRPNDAVRGPDVEFLGGRWGLDSSEYAWEVALLMGFAYWLVHGSVEWLWHMPGVAMVALLLFAASVASIDARAGVMWPRWAALIGRGGSTHRAANQPPDGDSGEDDPADDDPTEDEDLAAPADRTGSQGMGALGTIPLYADAPFTGYRRADRHRDKRNSKDRRSERRSTRRGGGSSSLWPPGPLSVWFRGCLIAGSLAALAVLTPQYLSLRYQDLALANSSADSAAALGAAATAARLLPISPAPLTTTADVYETAGRLADADRPAGQGARLDALALTLDARESAVELDPLAWALHFKAALAALRLAEALEEGNVATEAGSTSDSPALTPEAVATAAHLRDLSPEELRESARAHLTTAQERNPLNAQVARTLLELDEQATIP
ncbi:MAG: O-antigen ligase family protein [Actinobacteria bacterium]|nr:O-antigen ligase family protein [Actinomycetota bacterium]